MTYSNKFLIDLNKSLLGSTKFNNILLVKGKHKRITKENEEQFIKESNKKLINMASFIDLDATINYILNGGRTNNSKPHYYSLEEEEKKKWKSFHKSISDDKFIESLKDTQSSFSDKQKKYLVHTILEAPLYKENESDYRIRATSSTENKNDEYFNVVISFLENIDEYENINIDDKFNELKQNILFIKKNNKVDELIIALKQRIQNR